MALPSGPDSTAFCFYFPGETPATLGLGFFLLLALVTWYCFLQFPTWEEGRDFYYWGSLFWLGHSYITVPA